MIPESEEQTPVQSPTTTTTSLPGVFELFAAGWKYVQSNLWLVFILSAPFVVVDTLAFASTLLDGVAKESVEIVLGASSFVALVLYILFAVASVYLVAHQEEAPDFNIGFAWAKKNIWRMIWIGLLSAIIVSGGFLLLIIPGIIISVYITFSQIILVREQKTGLAALLRSRELVFGNWWQVAARIFGIQALYFGILIVIGLVVVGSSAVLLDTELSTYVGNLVFTMLGSAGTLLFLYTTVRMYETLKIMSEESAIVVPKADTKYKALGWFGLVASILLIVLIAAAVTSSWGVPRDNSADRAAIAYAQFEAEQYYTAQPDMSYSGVCEEIETFVSEKGAVTCNDSDSAYALSLKQQDTVHCIDSTGYNKIIYTDIGENTKCLSL